MSHEIFARGRIPSPPAGFEDAFWNWVWEAGRELDVMLFDDHPVPPEELREFIGFLGDLPRELRHFYAQCTPWGAQRDGPTIWKEHLRLVEEAAVRNDALAHGGRSDTQVVVEQLRAASPLWPVYVSQKANVAAFLDQRDRLGIIDVNIGVNLGRPLAIGIRNYAVMTVVGEVVWEEKNYATYEQVLEDELVRAAGGWEHGDPPQHPLVRLYQELRPFRIDS